MTSMATVDIGMTSIATVDISMSSIATVVNKDKIQPHIYLNAVGMHYAVCPRLHIVLCK